MHAYIHTCIHAYLHAYIYIYIYIYTCLHTQTYIHKGVHMYVRDTYVLTHVRTWALSNTEPCKGSPQSMIPGLGPSKYHGFFLFYLGEPGRSKVQRYYGFQSAMDLVHGIWAGLASQKSYRFLSMVPGLGHQKYHEFVVHGTCTSLTPQSTIGFVMVLGDRSNNHGSFP